MGQWFRQTNCHGEFWLGQQRYNVGTRWAKHELAIRFDVRAGELVLAPGGSLEALRQPIKGLTVEALMGAAAQPRRQPSQLLLPFPSEIWRVQLQAA